MSTLALRALGGERSAWRTHLTLLGAAAAAILLLFRQDAADVVAIWSNDSTFNHCFLILPIIAWLVAQRLPQLRALTPAAWWPGLLAVGCGALSWLAGEASGIDVARHFGLLLMLEGAVVAILGKAVARGLTFPLFYALFLLPVGSEIVPAMQTVTAEVAALLLSLTNVPAHLQGIFITTPTGYFEVAEACAGVKFLIAMVAFAALVANTCYRSWRRRAAFIAVAIAVPVLANGVRAWGTIFIAHLTDLGFAAGFDHVFYGFFFFAFVIALVLGIGWRFFDRRVGEPWFDSKALEAEPPRPARLELVAAAALGLALVPPVWTNLVVAAGVVSLPAQPVMPEVAGWQRVAARGGIPWQPHFAGADRITVQRYRDVNGRSVDLAIALFVRQQEGRELVGFGQGATAPNGRWAWTADAPAPPDGRAERIASHGLERQVVSFYRVGDIVTGSGVGVKLETMKVRLLGGPQRAVAVLVSSDSRAAIDDFLRALGPVAPLADRAAGL
ncbi:MAG TPA: exosortase A [Allosphingosinicella sp.]|nr:exosortase A [Allosphingosinicella sp.]